MTLAALVFGSSRKARRLFTQSSSGLLSVVPRKLAGGVVPAFPVRLQPPPPPPAAARVRVLPFVVRVTLAPAARTTSSVRPLRVLTTAPLAMEPPVMPLRADP